MSEVPLYRTRGRIVLVIVSIGETHFGELVKKRQGGLLVTVSKEKKQSVEDLEEGSYLRPIDFGITELQARE